MMLPGAAHSSVAASPAGTSQAVDAGPAATQTSAPSEVHPDGVNPNTPSAPPEDTSKQPDGAEEKRTAEAQRSAASPGGWKHLGNGYWQDGRGARTHPQVMAPWKDLGTVWWEDSKGRRVPTSELPAWVYLGDGKWFTPRRDDWLKNIANEPPSGSAAAERPAEAQPVQNATAEQSDERAGQYPQTSARPGGDEARRIVNRQRIRIVNR
jgi:hypothetical protein